MSERVWTVIEILNTARGYLEEKGIENPRGNAESLLCKALGLTRVDLYVQHDRPMEIGQVNEFRELLRRRAKHEPLQLILGSVEFCGVTIDTAPGLLIPRPETEELAEWVIAHLSPLEISQRLRVLDIGTGTGCLALAIANRVKSARVDAVDLDFEAVRCATHNAERNGVADRVRVVLADLFSTRFESVIEPPYDVVVSNPPYVTEQEYQTLAPEVRDHEARHALVGPENGLAFYRRISSLLPTLLKPGGTLAVEIGATQGDAVINLFAEILRPVTLHRDMAGKPRIVTGTLQVVPSSKPIPSS
jgi:release factor glutamine methyltransferase